MVIEDIFRWLSCVSVLTAFSLGGAESSGGLSANPDLPAPDYAPLIRKCREYIPPMMEKEGIPGLSIALVGRKEILWSEGFGWGDQAKSIPVTTETLFSLQSNSKTVTSTAIMIAVQKGLLDLDAPITRYLPDFKVQSCWEERPERRITLRHLLSHTAGFTHEAPVGNNGDAEMSSFEAHIRSIPGTWLKFPVGERMSYSNLGIDLAGYILQTVSGERFEEVARKSLLEPLGMDNSSFDMAWIRQAGNRARGYDRVHGENPAGVSMIPAAGLYAGVTDMAKFVQFHLQGGRVRGKTVLEERFLDAMYTVPFVPEGFPHGCALGIFNRKRFGSEICMSHSGKGFGFMSDMMWLPEHGLGLVILTNKGDHQKQGGLALQILGDALKILPHTPRPPAPPPGIKPFEAARQDRARLVGTYGVGTLSFTIREKDGALVADMTGLKGEIVPLVLTSATEGELRGSDWAVPIRFVLDRDKAPRRGIVDSTTMFVYDDPLRNRETGFKAEWEKYLGDYQAEMFGKPLPCQTIRREKGDLYLDSGKLREHQPGLFFTDDGEAIDLRTDIPTFRNMRFKKK